MSYCVELHKHGRHFLQVDDKTKIVKHQQKGKKPKSKWIQGKRTSTEDSRHLNKGHREDWTVFAHIKGLIRQKLE